MYNHYSKTINQIFVALFFSMLLATPLFAQDDQSDIEIIQEAFGLEKKVAVSNFMQLDKDSEQFWTLYDEYEFKRKNLGKQRIMIIEDYIEKFPTITDEQIQELFNKTSKLKSEFGKLQNSYFKKMSKAVGIKKATQFYQIENYFNAIIQAEIYSKISFIGENLEGN
jgi:hypothetical protein